MLACPRCGAAVPESSPSCAYCSAPLLLKACPECLARVFHGHTYCPNCSAGLDDRAGERRERSCPRCKAALRARAVGDLVLDDCDHCGGTFVDRAALEKLLADRRGARAESVLGAYDPAGDDPLPQPAGPVYIKCPDCGNVMNRKQFARGARVIVDVCRHGTWFDAHELPRILKFVMSGGLERAQKKELEETREQMRREAAALRGTRADASTTDVDLSFFSFLLE